MTTYSSQPDDTIGIDTKILSDEFAAVNYATDTTLAIVRYSAALYERSLIKFDLSTIPSNATIISAVLSIWVSTDYATTTATVSAYRLLRDWVEAQATWNIWKAANNWGTGGGGAAADIDLTFGSWGSFNTTATEAANSEKQLSFDVSEFKKFADGTYPNYGWLLKTGEVANADGYLYHSSSSATAGYRPKLIVEYILGGQLITWTSE